MNNNISDTDTHKKIIAVITALVVVVCIILVAAFKKVIIPDSKYKKAMKLYRSGKYDEAISAFKDLKGYKDSKSQLEKCYIGKLGEEKYNYISNIRIGDTYTFGSYEQDNITSNGKEDIEWIVLDKDGMSLFLISKYALDQQPYTSDLSESTWENSTLRKWLNETFINEAFSQDEQRSIINTTVTADKNPLCDTTSQGNSTTDKVFIPSIKEAEDYFDSDDVRKCKGTEYCYARGAVKSPDNGNCWWWLRTLADTSRIASVVDDDGPIQYGKENGGDYVTITHTAVRPAMWIDPVA